MQKKIVSRGLKLIKEVNQGSFDENKVLLGRLLAGMNADKKITNLSEVEFKVFSQWGDDGIIQYIISNMDVPKNSKVFVEFGVENYTESNTRFLLVKDNWSGLILDGSKENIEFVKNDGIFWKHDLTAINAFINKDNINKLIKDGGVEGEIGILSIDIDGNDYWVWDAINVVNPFVVIIEYNSLWSFDKPYVILYDENFVRSKWHYSNLYWGTSLLSACDLAEQRGYDFIGCNSAGNNAYFVRKDKSAKLPKLTPEEGFVDAKFRESRNKEGKLSFLSGEKKRDEIKGLTVFNTRTKKEEIL